MQVDFTRMTGQNPKASIFPYTRNGWINLFATNRSAGILEKYLVTFAGNGNRVVSIDQPINGLDWAQVLHQLVRENAPKIKRLNVQLFWHRHRERVSRTVDSTRETELASTQSNKAERKEWAKNLFPMLSQLNRAFSFFAEKVDWKSLAKFQRGKKKLNF